MADGSLLSFMNEAEIYSMLGNAIDNAFSAVRELEEENRRIGLTVQKVKNFVTVQVRNRYKGEIVLSGDGLPVTTKSDSENHGFGLKSIRYIVEKYGGRMSVKAQEGEFSLNIIFPVKGDAS